MWDFQTFLKTYELASGQVVNVEKSALYFSPNVSTEFQSVISNILSMPIVDNLGKYLGVHSSFSKNRRDDFKAVKQRVWHTLQGWKDNLFSIGGKEVLIKSVVQAIPTYIMSCFRLPQTLCDDIQKMIARFWWGSTDNKRKSHRKKWDYLCRPKELGGLNFRDLVSFNKALLAKQVWRLFTNPQLLASRVIQGRYAHRDSLLLAPSKANCSVFWRGFVWVRNLLMAGM